MITTPHLSVDGIIELYSGSEFRGVVIIERHNPPHGYALPGGFVDVGERVETALIREMQEETTLEVNNLKLLGVYSDPKRDKRFHTVSIVYVCRTEGRPKAADDAKSLFIAAIDELSSLELVFDHKQIIADYLEQFHA